MRRIYTHVGTIETLRYTLNLPAPKMSRANYWTGCALFSGLGIALALIAFFS